MRTEKQFLFMYVDTPQNNIIIIININKVKFNCVQCPTFAEIIIALIFVSKTWFPKFSLFPYFGRNIIELKHSGGSPQKPLEACQPEKMTRPKSF